MRRVVLLARYWHALMLVVTRLRSAMKRVLCGASRIWLKPISNQQSSCGKGNDQRSRTGPQCDCTSKGTLVEPSCPVSMYPPCDAWSALSKATHEQIAENVGSAARALRAELFVCCRQ